MPVGHFDFRFRAVNDGLVKCDRKTDSRIFDLIVIRIVGHVTSKIVRVNFDLSVEDFGQTRLVVVAFRRLHQPEKVAWVDGLDRR